MAMKCDEARSWRRDLKEGNRVEAYLALDRNYVRFVGESLVLDQLIPALEALTGTSAPRSETRAPRSRMVALAPIGQTTIDDFL